MEIERPATSASERAARLNLGEYHRMSLPLFKVGILAVRTVSKPVANSVKGYAKDHAGFRSVCAATGQTWHQIVSRVNIRLLGHRVSKVKQLPEDEAVTKGADFFGELLIYMVSVGGVMAEVARSSKESQRKAREKAHRQMLKEERLTKNNLDLNARIDAMLREQEQLKNVLQRMEVEQQHNRQQKRRTTWWPFAGGETGVSDETGASDGTAVSDDPAPRLPARVNK